jgi:TRAP-type C4-dicarboxylate transport system permease large subunit
MMDTFRGVAPFFAAEIVRVALLAAFPALILWLPGMLAG